ncbi:MAG: DUF123 domain-containing protein [Thermoprotei archaeon]|nr:MAG: DUF123 domain-containing protein [Thermoprotei archaeon]
MISLPDKPGVYVLVVKVREDATVTVRSSRVFGIPRGIYLYIGSARGIGGLKSRVLRHVRGAKSMFWHIDYLLAHPSTSIAGVYYAVVGKSSDYESMLSSIMAREFNGIKGFGCSDKKKDYSHLYYCGNSLKACLYRASFLLNMGFKYVPLEPITL